MVFYSNVQAVCGCLAQDWWLLVMTLRNDNPSRSYVLILHSWHEPSIAWQGTLRETNRANCKIDLLIEEWGCASQPWAMLVYQRVSVEGWPESPKVVDSMSAWQSMTAAFPRSSGATLKECWRALTRLQREACVAAAACLIYLLYFNMHLMWWKFHFIYKAKMSMIAYMHMPLTICLGRWCSGISLQNTPMISAAQSSSRATNKRYNQHVNFTHTFCPPKKQKHIIIFRINRPKKPFQLFTSRFCKCFVVKIRFCPSIFLTFAFTNFTASGFHTECINKIQAFLRWLHTAMDSWSSPWILKQFTWVLGAAPRCWGNAFRKTGPFLQGKNQWTCSRFGRCILNWWNSFGMDRSRNN